MSNMHEQTYTFGEISSVSSDRAAFAACQAGKAKMVAMRLRRLASAAQQLAQKVESLSRLAADLPLEAQEELLKALESRADFVAYNAAFCHASIERGFSDLGIKGWQDNWLENLTSPWNYRGD